MFLKGLKFLRKKTKKILWGILEIGESDEWQTCAGSDKFGLNKTSQKKPEKLD